MSDVTRILGAIDAGNPQAVDELLPLVYDELRKLAAARMANEKPGQTLQATALVHEAWLRLSGPGQRRWQNRAHFIAAAAEAMRRILVENARRKLSLKRGGGQEREEFDDSEIACPVDDEKILEVHAALETLLMEDPQQAQIVKLRFFVGLTNEEIAALFGVNEKTVRRHWELARVRLFRAIQGE